MLVKNKQALAALLTLHADQDINLPKMHAAANTATKFIAIIWTLQVLFCRCRYRDLLLTLSIPRPLVMVSPLSTV